MFRTEFNTVFLSVCFAIGLIKCATDDPIQTKKRYQLECIEETRVDPDIITRIKKRDWSYISVSSISNVKAWALCTLMKNGLMTKEGVYNIDVALAKVPEPERPRAEKLIDACLSTKAIPAADIAYKFVKCFQRTKANYTVSIFV